MSESYVSHGKLYRKKEGENYAEGVVPNYDCEFKEIYFKITPEALGTGFTWEQFEDEYGTFKAVQWKLHNVTKDITVNMDVARGPYNEKTITENWIGDTVRAMPKLGCTELQYVEFGIFLHYSE